MKKIISLILAVIMIFSVTAVATFAADEAEGPVKITFTYDGPDKNGLPIPKTKVIYVQYDEDYTSKAPKETYISGGYKYYIEGWEAVGYGDGTIYSKALPKISKGDGITEVTFKACMGAEVATAGGMLGDAAEDILGENTINFFNYIIEQLRLWFGKLILFLRNFA